ncbi:MAG: hypothetical protein ACI8ZB_003044 [Desulforhopalus sp.]|jgi:hypothetical protein
MKVQQICGFCFVAMVGFFPCTNIVAEELPWERKTPFENATIIYTIDGVEQGEEILYIRNFGKEQARYLGSTTKIMGIAVTEKSVEFVDADYVYSYDLQAKEGMKRVNPQKYMAKAFDALTLEEKKQVQKNVTERGGFLTEGMAGAVEKNATKILGYACDKVDIMGGGATYILHGTDIPLKTEVKMMGMKMITTVTSIDTGKVDPQYFIHPKGIEAMVDAQADAMAEAMGQQVIDTLKDPEAAKKGAGTGMHDTSVQENMTDEDKQMMEQAGELLKGMQDLFGQ